MKEQWQKVIAEQREMNGLTLWTSFKVMNKILQNQHKFVTGRSQNKGFKSEHVWWVKSGQVVYTCEILNKLESANQSNRQWRENFHNEACNFLERLL